MDELDGLISFLFNLFLRNEVALWKFARGYHWWSWVIDSNSSSTPPSCPVYPENELAGAKGTVNYQFRDPVQLTPLEGRKRFVWSRYRTAL